MIAKTPWRLELDEKGGKDSVTAAYVIRDIDGRKLFVVDFKEFETPADAQEVARRIVNVMNSQKSVEAGDVFNCPGCGGHKYTTRAVDPCDPRAGQIVFCTTDQARCRWRSH